MSACQPGSKVGRWEQRWCPVGCSGQCDAGPSHCLVAAAVGEAAPDPGKAVGGLCVQRRLFVSCLLQSWPGQRGGATGHQMHRLGLRQAGADGCLEGALAPGPAQQGLTASPASSPPTPACSPVEGRWGPGGGETPANIRSANRQELDCGSTCRFYCWTTVLLGSGGKPENSRERGLGSSCLAGVPLTGEKEAWPDSGPWTTPLSLS